MWYDSNIVLHRHMMRYIVDVAIYHEVILLLHLYPGKSESARNWKLEIKTLFDIISDEYLIGSPKVFSEFWIYHLLRVIQIMSSNWQSYSIKSPNVHIICKKAIYSPHQQKWIYEENYFFFSGKRILCIINSSWRKFIEIYISNMKW